MGLEDMPRDAVDVNVTNVEVDREIEVRLTFDDGSTCVFPLVDLRVACPCATCRGQRDAGQAPWPRAGTPERLAIVDAELVGAWGISFTWNDGHNTGIYPWASMRKWCEADHLTR